MLENLTIAHRGVFNNKNIPENSILAFKTALKENYPIEFDIQMTKDNKLIVFHDDNLKRMTGKDIIVSEVDYKDIKNMYLLKTKQKIPTFKEVLKLVNGKVLLDIEIKTTKRKKEIVNKVLEELESYKGEVLLKSFDPIIMKKIKRKTKKKYTIGLLIDDHYDKKIINFIFKKGLPLKYLRPNFIAVNKKMLNKFYYYKMSKKYNIFIWTVTSHIQKEHYKKEYNNINFICNNLLDK